MIKSIFLIYFLALPFAVFGMELDDEESSGVGAYQTMAANDATKRLGSCLVGMSTLTLFNSSNNIMSATDSRGSFEINPAEPFSIVKDFHFSSNPPLTASIRAASPNRKLFLISLQTPFYLKTTHEKLKNDLVIWDSVTRKIVKSMEISNPLVSGFNAALSNENMLLLPIFTFKASRAQPKKIEFIVQNKYSNQWSKLLLALAASPSEIKGFFVSSDAKNIIIAQEQACSIALIDATDAINDRKVFLSITINDIKYCPENFILVTGEKQTILKNLDTDQLTFSTTHPDSMKKVAFNGARGLIAASCPRLIKLYDIRSAEPIKTLQGDDFPDGLDFSPNGSYLLDVGMHKFSLWELRKFQTLDQVKLPL